MNFEQNSTLFRRYLYFILPGYLFVNDCLMSEFLLRRENFPGLKKWVHIEELALQNNNQARVNSFADSCRSYLHFYNVPDEKLDGFVKNEGDNAFPDAPAIFLTGKEIYAERSYFETGSLCWVNRQLKIQNAWSNHYPRKWSDISPQKFISTRNKLFLSIWPDAGLIRKKMEKSELRTINISIQKNNNFL